MAKAVRVQAANAIPRRSNSVGSSGIREPSAKNGWKYQETSRLNSPAAAAATTASRVS
jgi:hypothetical protein